MLAKLCLTPQALPGRDAYPCRCLCRASEQITRTTPPRRITLQLRQIFLTEARTFIFVLRFPNRKREGGEG